MEKDTKQKLKNNIFIRIILGCSLRTNGLKILNSDPPKGEDFACFHGIRTLSISWVVVGHTYNAVANYPVKNKKFGEDVSNNFFIMPKINILKPCWNCRFSLEKGTTTLDMNS